MRLQSCKKIYKYAPIYNGELNASYDIVTGQINTDLTDFFFFVIIKNGNLRTYCITASETELFSINFIVKVYVLSGNVDRTDPFFRVFCLNLLDQYIYDDRNYSTNPTIISNSDYVSIRFDDFEVRYKSRDSNLTNVLIYEYFTRIQNFDNTNKFTYNPNTGFTVRGAKVSIAEFFERFFQNLYGDFSSGNSLAINLLFQQNYEDFECDNPILKETGSDNIEYLLFSETVILNPIICRQIEIMLLL